MTAVNELKLERDEGCCLHEKLEEVLQWRYELDDEKQNWEPTLVTGSVEIDISALIRWQLEAGPGYAWRKSPDDENTVPLYMCWDADPPGPPHDPKDIPCHTTRLQASAYKLETGVMYYQIQQYDRWR